MKNLIQELKSELLFVRSLIAIGLLIRAVIKFVGDGVLVLCELSEEATDARLYRDQVAEECRLSVD